MEKKWCIVIVLMGLILMSACTSLQQVDRNKKGYEGKGYVDIRESKQYIEVEGRDISKPVLLYLHGGPFGAETPMARFTYEKLKDDFIVVLWDQRGAGKSYDGKLDEKYLTIDSFVEDAKELTEYLMKKFDKKKIYVHGHSWGSLLGMKLIKKYPELYYAYVGDGQFVSGPRNFKVSYDLMMEEAEREHKYLREMHLKELGRPSIFYVDPDRSYTWKEWDRIIKGERYYKYLTQYTDHSVYSQAKLQLYGIYCCLGTWNYNPFVTGFRRYEENSRKLFKELWNTDLLKEGLDYKVPLYFAVGRHDLHTPYVLVEEMYDKVEAPHKEIVWFEDSAHCPHLEEGAKFAELMRRVKGETLDYNDDYKRISF